MVQIRIALLTLFLAAGLGCKSNPEAVETTEMNETETTASAEATEMTETTPSSAAKPAGDALGVVSADELFDGRPGWRSVAEAYEPNAAAIETIAAAEDVTIEVYLGTWCPDSQREVSRWIGAVSDIDGGPDVRYVGLDRSMSNVEKPATLTNVPTFYVRRGDQELGRVVETSVEPIEVDIADLIRGERSGFISSTVEPPTR